MSGKPLIPVDGKLPDWPRRVAAAINKLNNTRHIYQELASAPANPTEGSTYYDLTLHTVRTWNGSAWNNHF